MTIPPDPTLKKDGGAGEPGPDRPKALPQSEGASFAAKHLPSTTKTSALPDAWWLASFLLLVIFFVVLASAAHSNPHFTWDVSLADRIQSISVPGFSGLMAGVSVIGESPATWIVLLLAGLGLWWAGRRVEATVCALGSAVGSGVNTLLKFVIARPRPAAPLVHVMKHYQHKSFPSGHVFFFVEFFGFLLFLSIALQKPSALRHIVIVVLILLIALVGISRIYLGAHWPSDVTGGYLGGAQWLMLMIEAHRRLKAGPGAS